MTDCNDNKCYRHGDINTRGESLEGEVVSDKSKKTVIVKRPIIKYYPKFNRWARDSSKIPAHNPSCLDAEEGDKVKISETRKISKTKSWTVTEILGDH